MTSVAQSVKPRYPTKAMINRAIMAGRENNLDVVGFEIQPDGTVRVLDRSAIPAPAPADEFEAWDAQGKL